MTGTDAGFPELQVVLYLGLRLEGLMRLTSLAFLLLSSTTSFAADPVKLCVAQPGGSEGKNWRIQSSLAHKIEALASSKQIVLTSPLLDANDEKHAKSEGQGKACSYVLLTTIEKSNQQVSGTFNPSPTGERSASPTSSMAQAAMAPEVKYKLITVDGKKVHSSSVIMVLKGNALAADYEEAGKKLIDKLAEEAVNALPK